jgi:hypothetical protein
MPPSLGGAPLLLEADADGDGRFETLQGAVVPPGSAMRVRSLSRTATGFVRVRANGTALLERRLPAGGNVAFRSPTAPGWVRATLYSEANPPMKGDCNTSTSPISTCTYDTKLLALTSPLYTRVPTSAGVRVRFSIARRQSLRTIERRRGVRVGVSCSGPCRVSGLARVRARRAGRGNAALRSRGKRTLTVRLDRRALRALRPGSRIGLRLSVAGGRTARLVVTVRR